MDVLKRVEAGIVVPDLCRELGHQQCYVLQVASQVRRHGYVDDGPNERARRRESTAQENVRRRTDESRDRCRGPCKKVVRP